MTVKRLSVPAQLPRHFFLQRHLVHLFVALEGEFLNGVTPIVYLAVLEVWYQVVNSDTVLLEGTTGGHKDVTNDLVNLDKPSNVATFVGLCLDFFGPMLRDTLRLT